MRNMNFVGFFFGVVALGANFFKHEGVLFAFGNLEGDVGGGDGGHSYIH